MSNLIEHAKRELEIAGFFKEDSDYGGMLADSVMELIKVFSDQGHSGYSAARTIQLFEKLASYKTLMPLTGEDDEWSRIDDGKEDFFQNKRDFGVFKRGKDGKPYFSDAITWKTQSGSCWHAHVDGIGSAQQIKSFPFYPKTFVIDVIEEEVSPDNWEFHIKNTVDLDQVWEYYDKKEA